MKTPSTEFSNSQSSKSDKPFFNKSGQEHFFSKDAQNESPFFKVPFIQTKLTVGAPNDPYEKEADQMAHDVVQNLSLSKPISTIQRKCENCEDELIQNKSDQYQSSTVSSSFESQLKQSKGSGQPLDNQTKQKMEKGFSADFSNVKIHTGTNANQMNQEVGARAFTNGNDVYFNSGNYNPETEAGNFLLAHELTHVIQQKNRNSLMQKQEIENGETSDLIQRDTTTTFVEGGIRGHASPRWEHTGGNRRAELNLQLSRDRANQVEYLFQEMFRRHMRGRGDIEFAVSTSFEDHRDPSSVNIPSEAVGDRETIIEAGGDQRANEQSMRRVDINVVITQQVEGEAGSTETVIIPEECMPHATNQWSIKLALSGGAGHAGLGGAFAIGKLKNRRTGQIAEGSFVGGGIGAGLQTPGADPGWGDWTDFVSEDVCTFADYNNTLCRLTSAGAGIALIGGSLTWISFPMRGANSIFVGGFNMGALGADASTNVGNWNVHGDPPGPPCRPEEAVESHGSSPYQFDIQDALRHTVYFETGEAELDDNQFELLDEFVQEISSRYSVDETGS